MEEECLYTRGKFHSTKCTWYHPGTIYILDTKGDLSTSEQVAQQKIYHIYLNTLNNPPENCGVEQQLKYLTMGHNTGCIEFLHLHERESYKFFCYPEDEKKMTFHEDPVVEPKRAKLDPIMEAAGKNGATDEIKRMKEVPRAKEIQSNLSQATTDALSVLADTAIATSDHIPPNNPPNSFPDIVTDSVTETVSGADCPCEDDDEEMPPLKDIDQ